MAKQIIVLERQEGAQIVVTVAYWLTVAPPLRQAYFARAGAKSVWAGAAVAENNAIAAGSVVEVVEQVTMIGTTVPAMQAELLTRFSDKQAALDASVKLFRYGSFCDAGVWTMVVP